jgi:outer membrane protein TolC
MQEPTTLASLRQEALKNNPPVQSASHQVQALRHKIPQAKALPDPTVGVGWEGNCAPFSMQTGDPASYHQI